MEEKKGKSKDLKTKVDLVSVQKDVLKEKDMGTILGGGGDDQEHCTGCTTGQHEEPLIVFLTTG